MSTYLLTDRCTDLILDFIAKHESLGNYNAVIDNANATRDLSALTLTEIDFLQSELKAAGKRSTAIGRYQFLQATLRGLKTKLRLKDSDLFTPTLQDRLAVELMVGRGYKSWWRDKMDDANFLHNLSMEWASLPDPYRAGKSYYDGIAGNSAAYTLSECYDMFDRAWDLKEAPPVPITLMDKIKMMLGCENG